MGDGDRPYSFGARGAQDAGRFLQRGTRGFYVVQEYDRPIADRGAIGYGKRARHIFQPLFPREFHLGLCPSYFPQDVVLRRNAELRAERLCDEQGLIESADALARAVQGNGDDDGLLREYDSVVRNRAVQQCAENLRVAARAAVFQIVNQRFYRRGVIGKGRDKAVDARFFAARPAGSAGRHRVACRHEFFTDKAGRRDNGDFEKAFTAQRGAIGSALRTPEREQKIQ